MRWKRWPASPSGVHSYNSAIRITLIEVLTILRESIVGIFNSSINRFQCRCFRAIGLKISYVDSKFAPDIVLNIFRTILRLISKLFAYSFLEKCFGRLAMTEMLNAQAIVFFIQCSDFKTSIPSITNFGCMQTPGTVLAQAFDCEA